MLLEDYRAAALVPAHQARVRPSAPAIVYDGTVTDYATLDRRSDRIAARLVGAGVARGARVGVLGKNSGRYLDVIFGIMKAGAVATTVNWRLAPEEVAFIVGDADMPLLFVEEAFDPLLDTARQRGRFETVLMDEGSAAFDTWLQGAKGVLPAALGDPDEIVLQMYTSGTTGQPKGVMLSNRNFTKYCGLEGAPYPGWWQVHPTDISLIALPLFHIGSLEAAFRILFSGGSIVLHREFDPGEVLESIRRHRPTILSLVPTALHMVLRAPDAATVDFTCIQSFFYGAAPITLELLREAVETMRCNFVQCYGLTEANSSVVALPPEDHDPEGTPKMRAAGKPLPGVEIRVVDGEGVDCPTGRTGEIFVRAVSVMEGYWKRPEASASTVDADGWLHTGDAGCLDEDGYVYVRDRVKDMVISGGENIYPAEVESAIFGHPAVAEVAVIGVPDEKWGEAVKAVIVLNPDAVFDEAGLIEWTRSRIASYKVPRSFSVVDELPKNASGKLLKTRLRAIFSPAAPGA